jgi:Flp pilus assembly protein TadB
VIEFEEETPPAGEQLHVPRSSWLPVLLAVGLMLALVGVTVSIVFTVVGLLITIPVLVRWIRSAREDMAELPPGH